MLKRALEAKRVIVIERANPLQQKRVAAYCRVSTDKDDQLESLENQIAAFSIKIAQHPDWSLTKIYADEGLTGTTVKGRTQFGQMIEDCQAGKIDYIITKSISRFARNTLDVIRYVRLLQGYGVSLYFEKEGIDTGDASSELLLTIMASFAQEESRSISENVKWGIRKRFAEGKEPRVRLYGYRHTEEAAFQIVPEEAMIVREVFARYVHGELPSAILRDMIARGVKPPARGQWKRLQLERMLKNERYAGNALLQKTYTENHLTHKQVRNWGELPKYFVPNAHDAIVDRHMFDQAQKIFALRRIRSGSSSYPYGEMLSCPHCGAALVHGSLNGFVYNGEHIRNGGWGCYGESGCRGFLLIQNVLDEAILSAYAEKFHIKRERVDFYWLEDDVETIALTDDQVCVRWRDGETCRARLNYGRERYNPARFAGVYNAYLLRVSEGNQRNPHPHLMGLAAAQKGDMCGNHPHSG